MINIKQLDSLEILEDLKRSYLHQAVAPLDGMWLCGFVPKAQHFGFYANDNLVGYYCLDHDGFVLQFYLEPKYRDPKIFSSLFKGTELSVGRAKGAFVSTAEPQYLSYCLDHFDSFEVNSLMYRQTFSDEHHTEQPLSILGEALEQKQLDEACIFAHAAIGAPREWLFSYFHNLIKRQELFGAWDEEGKLIATGECRGYDNYQTEYADVGMIVSQRQRCKGIATRVLKDLLVIAKHRGLEPICSTERDNIAAQKSITRSGFIADHRILKFTKNAVETNLK